MNALLQFVPQILLKTLGTSYRTSLGALGLWAGALGVLIDVLSGNNPADEIHVSLITGGFSAGWVAWHAKDKQVTGSTADKA